MTTLTPKTEKILTRRSEKLNETTRQTLLY